MSINLYNINKKRQQIDSIDNQIALLLLERKKIVIDIATAKKKIGKTGYDNNRELFVFNNLKRICNSIDFLFLRPIFEMIILQSREFKKKI